MVLALLSCARSKWIYRPLNITRVVCRYFVSDFETGDGESIAVLNSYTHDGEWVWMLNSTSPLASAEFVDRKGSALEPTFNPSTLFFDLCFYAS